MLLARDHRQAPAPLLPGFTGSLLDTNLHFCYKKTLTGMKKVLLNISSTGNQLRVSGLVSYHGILLRYA